MQSSTQEVTQLEAEDAQRMQMKLTALEKQLAKLTSEKNILEGRVKQEQNVSESTKLQLRDVQKSLEQKDILGSTQVNQLEFLNGTLEERLEKLLHTNQLLGKQLSIERNVKDSQEEALRRITYSAEEMNILEAQEIARLEDELERCIASKDAAEGRCRQLERRCEKLQHVMSLIDRDVYRTFYEDLGDDLESAFNTSASASFTAMRTASRRQQSRGPPREGPSSPHKQLLDRASHKLAETNSRNMSGKTPTRQSGGSEMELASSATLNGTARREHASDVIVSTESTGGGTSPGAVGNVDAPAARNPSAEESGIKLPQHELRELRSTPTQTPSERRPISMDDFKTSVKTTVKRSVSVGLGEEGRREPGGGAGKPYRLDDMTSAGKASQLPGDSPYRDAAKDPLIMIQTFRYVEMGRGHINTLAVNLVLSLYVCPLMCIGASVILCVGNVRRRC
jgi:hypothetical protein